MLSSQSLVDTLETLLLAEVQMLEALHPQVGGNKLAQEPLHEGSSCEHASGGLLVGIRDPIVPVTVSQAAKWFNRKHVGDDIESCKVLNVTLYDTARVSESIFTKPIAHVGWLPCLGESLQPSPQPWMPFLTNPTEQIHYKRQ